MVTPRLLAVLCLGSILAGLPACAAAPPPPPASASAADVLRDLEDRLLHAGSLRMRAQASAQGSIQASFRGNWQLGAGNRARIAFQGSLRDQPSRAELVSSGTRMRGGSLAKSFEKETPPALREGLVQGFVRMGLLHDVVVLAGGDPPDGTDGTFGASVTWANVARGPNENVGGAPAVKLSFSVMVDGKPRGEAILWLDERTGMPVERSQTVHFPEGDMRVVEIYEELRIGDTPEESGFDVPAG